MAITEKTTVVEALQMSQSVLKIFKKYRLGCAGCRGAAQDTMAQVAVNNGLDVSKFIDELNGALKKS
jgi:hybrid cluster-associated redox disulfide protein